MLQYSDIADLVADNTPAEIAATLAADPRTARPVPLGDLMFVLNARGMLTRLIRPADTGEKWGGSVVNMILAVNDSGNIQAAGMVNQWFSHITNPNNRFFDTTEPVYSGQLAAMRASFADQPTMPTAADFDAIVELGGGLKYAGVTEADVQAVIARTAIEPVWTAKKAVVEEGIFNGTITTLEQIVAAIGGE
jgi:hypothetical protein